VTNVSVFKWCTVVTKTESHRGLLEELPSICQILHFYFASVLACIESLRTIKYETLQQQLPTYVSQ
jgi:hypothetical protein